MECCQYPCPFTQTSDQVGTGK